MSSSSSAPPPPLQPLGLRGEFQFGARFLCSSQRTSVKCFLTGVESSTAGFCKLSISSCAVKTLEKGMFQVHFAHGFFAPLNFRFNWCSFKLKAEPISVPFY